MRKQRWSSYIQELGLRSLIEKFDGDMYAISMFISTGNFFSASSKYAYVMRKIKSLVKREFILSPYFSENKQLLAEMTRKMNT